MSLTGGCACRAVRYEAEADPVLMLNCHCRDCQRATGSAYAALVVVPKATVRVQGTVKQHEVVGGSGKLVWREFCPSCGNPVSIRLEKMPGIVALAASSLDDPSIHNPRAEVFTESAQPWDRMLEATEKHARGIMK
ncbi:GFA family protein [Methylobacterium sp. WSM2598]|uniref:GFA family protein n=1 Tax=Methylobacterium sp. WSM2598 TaxID=398261 RepID=UPI00035DBD8A|nr:GFA family protein [Methylobacterium sp. WSM2598]